MDRKVAIIVASFALVLGIMAWLNYAATGPWIARMADLKDERPAPSPDQPQDLDVLPTTFIVHYEGKSPSNDLMLALENLSKADRISFVDFNSVSGLGFVHGDEDVLTSLKGLPGVTNISRADDIATSRAVSTGLSEDLGAQPQVLYYLKLDRSTTRLARSLLLEQLQSLKASGDISSFSEDELVVVAPASDREHLNRLAGVIAVDDQQGQSRNRGIGLSANGIITGVVTAEDGGAPISGTLVYVYQAYPYVDEFTITNAEGAYSIGVPAGSYRIRFVPPDYHIAEYYDDVSYWNAYSYTPVGVVDGATTSKINARLTPGLQIGGRISDEGTANPLGDVIVSVVGAQRSNSISSARTGADGVYTTTPGLPPGSYRVQFADSSGTHATEYFSNADRSSLASLVNLTATNRTGIDAVLGPAAVIAGGVSGSGPVSGSIVYAYNGVDGRFVQTTTTGIAGTYRLAGLSAGTYKLRFNDPAGNYVSEWYNDKASFTTADLISATAGATTTVDAQLAPAGLISGTVTAAESGAPLGDVRVYAYDLAGGAYVNSGFTDSFGVYRIGGLAAGSYKLWLVDNTGNYLSAYYNGRSDWSSADPVTVTTGLTGTANAQLNLAGVVSGIVMGQNSGAPLGNVSVQIYALFGSYYSFRGDIATDAFGIYRIGRLAAGNYRLRFYDNTGTYLGEYYNAKPNLNSADPVSVTTGYTTSLNSQLAPAGVVKGTVVAEESGIPLGNVGVYALDAAGQSLYSATTDAFGVYRLGSIPSGRYLLRFADNFGIYLSEYFDNKPDWSAASPIMVTAGLTVPISVDLKIGGRIAGRVIDSDSGAGIPGVGVSAVRKDGWSSATGWGYTDNDGYYATTAVYSGVYQVQFQPPQPYYPEHYDNYKPYYSFTPVTVSVPLTTTAINAVLRKGATISGTVTGSGPLASVLVSAYLESSSYAYYRVYTNQNGNYRLGPFDPGHVRVYFRPGGSRMGEWYNDSPGYYTATVLNIADDVTNVNAELGQGGVITGVVTGPGGIPLSGVWVDIFPVDSNYSVSSGLTDSGGKYAISPGLPTGVYQAYFNGPMGYKSEWYSDSSAKVVARAISVTAGLTTTDVNAQLAILTTGDTGAITGTVTTADTGLPLSMWVGAYRPDGQIVASAYASNGIYVLKGLVAGSYKLMFSNPPAPYTSIYYDSKTSLASADPVIVTANITTTNINQAIPRGGSITGTVAGPESISGVWVSAQRVTQEGYYYASTYSGLDGTYRLDGLAPGGYKVHFVPPSPFISEWFDNAAWSGPAFTVSVSLGAVTPNIDATLSTGGIITGSITASDSSAPLAGAYVYVFNNVTKWYSPIFYADMNGFYQTSGLPNDNYLVYFGAGNRGYVSKWYNTSVNIPSASARITASVMLDHGGSISGWTRSGPMGSMESGVQASAYNPYSGGYWSYGSNWSNDWGFYQINGLPTGQYKVQFSKPGFRFRWYNFASGFASAFPVAVQAPNDTPNIDANPGYGVFLPEVSRYGYASDFASTVPRGVQAP